MILMTNNRKIRQKKILTWWTIELIFQMHPPIRSNLFLINCSTNEKCNINTNMFAQKKEIKFSNYWHFYRSNESLLMTFFQRNRLVLKDSEELNCSITTFGDWSVELTNQKLNSRLERILLISMKLFSSQFRFQNLIGFGEDIQMTRAIISKWWLINHLKKHKRFNRSTKKTIPNLYKFVEVWCESIWKLS